MGITVVVTRLFFAWTYKTTAKKIQKLHAGVHVNSTSFFGKLKKQYKAALKKMARTQWKRAKHNWKRFATTFAR